MEPLVRLRLREKEKREMPVRVRVQPAALGFDPAMNVDDRPIKISGSDQPVAGGLISAQAGALTGRKSRPRPRLRPGRGTRSGHGPISANWANLSHGPSAALGLLAGPLLGRMLLRPTEPDRWQRAWTARTSWAFGPN
jgi:hypothetical protein